MKLWINYYDDAQTQNHLKIKSRTKIYIDSNGYVFIISKRTDYTFNDH